MLRLRLLLVLCRLALAAPETPPGVLAGAGQAGGGPALADLQLPPNGVMLRPSARMGYDICPWPWAMGMGMGHGTMQPEGDV